MTQHDVGVDQVFFSTTDEKGVITQANSVFVELSRYTREQLIGSPHNVNRSPLMPGGAFRVMWDTLQAGKPFGAYVMNRAADGSRYDVFATITPLPGGGYLSVRTRPCVEATRDAVWGLYADTLAYEETVAAGGAPRHEVAEQGAAHLAGLVAGVGFPSYDDFILAALPAEVAAREQLAAPLERAARLTGPMREIVDGVTDVWFGLEDHMDTLAGLDTLAADVEPSLDQITTTLADAARTSEEISALGDLGPGSAALMMPLTLWASMGGEVDGVLAPLPEDLGQLRESARQTRLRIALARLHATMVSTFAHEILADGPDASDAHEAIVALSLALEDGLASLGEQTRLHQALVTESAARLDEAASVASVPLDLMGAWRAGASGRTLPEKLVGLLPQVDAQLESSGEAVRRLRALAQACRDTAVEDDVAELQESVAQIRAAAATL